MFPALIFFFVLAIIQQGKVSGLMCAFTSLNGVPNCADDFILNQVMRAEYGFDGMYRLTVQNTVVNILLSFPYVTLLLFRIRCGRLW